MNSGALAERTKIAASHLRRRAVVYVRQSSPAQVALNVESAARQYALADRAVELGWPRESVWVIDEDTGRSGASTHGRGGFTQLVAEVGLGQVGSSWPWRSRASPAPRPTGISCSICARSPPR